jgi:phosphonate transport system ATP-binding protein
MLVVEHLSKTYGGVNALQDVSFTIKPHSFTTILGPSGAGKTTLLRCLTRLIQPDRGQIWLHGQELTNCPPRELRQMRSQMGMIAQQFNLIERRTALENCLAGRLHTLPLWRCLLGRFPAHLLQEGMAALARVQLLEVAFQRADCLSGGQQQRVAIARALTQGAQIILADEPIASLDPASAHLVLSLLQSLCQQEGLTVICNLHQVEFAKQYSDRILGMRLGKLILDAPVQALNEADIQQIYSPVYHPKSA